MKTLKYYYRTFLKKPKNFSRSNIRTKSIIESFDFLDRALAQKKRLFFVRFGDGEFVTLLKRDHRNYVYNNGLEKEIEASFRIKNEDYLISCPVNYPYDEFHAKGIYRNFSWQQEMIDLMQEKNFDTDILFENPCIFQCMAVFRPKRLKSFLDTHIRDQKKMFIGSTTKEVAEKLYGTIDYYVQIPVRNAYESIADWWPAVAQNVDKVGLVIPSAGSSSNVIALRLWNKGYRGRLIDFGSIVDAVENKESRSWIRLQGHKVGQLLKKSDREKLSFSKRMLFLRKDIKFFFRNQVI